MPLPRLVPAVSVLALAACGAPTSPAAPGGAAEVLTLDRTALHLTRPGDTAVVVATFGDRSTTTPALTIESEARYAAALPVLDPDELAAGRVRARAAGHVVLRVSAFGAAPARLSATVRPEGPMVLSAAQEGGDTVRLDGFRLDAVPAGGIRVGGDAAARAGGDSASLRIVVPPARGDECGSGGPERIGVDGAEVAPGVLVRRRHVDEVRLAPGEAVRLTGNATRCLRLPPEAGAVYALAYLDARKVRQARGGFEGYIPRTAFYAVTVAEAGAEAGAAARAAAGGRRATMEAGEPGHAPRRTLGPSAAWDALAGRAEPWRTGDVVRFPAPSGDSLATARVVGTFGAGLVLAAAEGEADAAWLARADSALRSFARHGAPLYAHALGSSRPSTAANGQLLVVAARGTGGLGYTEARLVGGRPRSLLVLDAGRDPGSATGLLRVLAHEAAHAWASEHFGGAPFGIGWSVEGTADLLAWLTVTRAEGIPSDGNWDWRAHAADARLRPAAHLALHAGDDFALGYASAAGFLLDVAGRVAERGMAWDDAVRETVRGALEGWHGWSAEGPRRRGLAERVRPALGAAWSPEEALLRWTLSQAADDRVPGALRNRAFLRAGEAAPGGVGGWRPAAVLRTGGSARRDDPGTSAAVTGNGVTTWPVYGSPGYLRIEDEGAGGAYALTATWEGRPLEEAVWMLLRER